MVLGQVGSRESRVEGRKTGATRKAWLDRLPGWTLDLAAIAALAILAAIHLRDPLAGRLPVSEEYDTLILQYPVHAAYGEALADGTLPWWVPEAGNGLPLVAEGEAGAFFPPNLLLFGLLSPFDAYALSLLLALVLLGAGTYGLTRALGADRPGALLAGAALMLSGFSLGHEHHLSLLRTAALLPWLLWVAEAHARRPRWTTAGLGAVVVALQWLAGNPQLAHLSAMTLALYLPIRAATETSGGARPRLRAAGLGLAGAATMVVVGMLVAAVQIVPSWLYTRETVRAGGLSLDDATVVGYPPRDLLLFFDPATFGTPMAGDFEPVPGERNLFWENVAYVGLLPLLLAPAALVFREHRRGAALLGGLALLGVVVALGDRSPVFRVLFAAVPGFDRFRVPQRWLLVTALAIVALGALALTTAARRLAAKWPAHAVLATALGITALGVWDVARVGDRYYPTVDRIDVERPSPTAFATDGHPLLAVPLHGIPTAPPGTDRRTSGWFGRDAMALVSHSLNVAWHVRSPLLYVGLLTARSQHLEERLVGALAAATGPDGVSRPGRAWTAAAGAVGAAYVTSFVPIVAPGLEETLRAEVRGFRAPVHVYRNRLARPRASLVAAARAAPNATAALDALLQHPDFDPAAETIVETTVPPETTSTTARAGTARVVAAGRAGLEIDTESDADAWLVVTDAPLKGWSATIDGRPAEILPADVLCRVVRVPAGRHRVSFRYDPPGRTAGWILSGIGLAVLGLLLAFRFRSEPRLWGRGGPRRRG